MKWKGKRVWVVGASSGIGEALVKVLADEGAKLIISSRREALLESLRQVADPDIKVLPIDLENHRELSNKAETAWAEFSGLDYIFLNAGMSVRDLVSETQIDAEQRIMNINFWGPVIITKALLPKLTKASSAHIVITSSLSGKYGVPKLAAYAASKHALHGYFESLRAETFQSGLKIHFAIPGFIKTNITVAGLRGDGSVNGEMQSSLEKGMHPLKCARQMLQKVSLGKEEFVVGGSEKYTVLLNRLFPGLSKKLIRSRPLKRVRNLKKKLGL